jgi:hypothetical protein
MMIFTTINIQTMKKKEMINTEYSIALIRYSGLYHVVHIWNMDTTELLSSNLVQEIPLYHHLCHVHFFLQRSTNCQYVIVIIEAFQAPFFNIFSNIYQSKINSNGKRTRQYKSKIAMDLIVQFESEGQIGIIMDKKGAISIMNLLTFDVIMKLNNTNTQMKISSCCSCSLVHLLPTDPFQFDCAPLLGISFPNAIVVCGYLHEVKMWHLIGSQIQSFHEYKYDSNIEIKCMGILPGD